MKYRELYELGVKSLSESGIEEAELDARFLLEHICHTDRHTLLVHGDREVDADQDREYIEAISLRKTRIPLQHITGVQEFMGIEFLVSPDVLIPRQDTEILVESALKHLHDGMKIMDMCTGSGCILLSLLKYSNDCKGLGVDLSEKALEIARKNANRLNLDASWVSSDLFAQIPQMPKHEKIDLLVSNPPYIRTVDINELMPEVKLHEPMIALDGKEDGLYFYRKILEDCFPFLNSGAWILFEIGYHQGQDVSDLMKSRKMQEVQIIKDYAGFDRVVAGVFVEDKNV